MGSPNHPKSIVKTKKIRDNIGADHICPATTPVKILFIPYHQGDLHAGTVIWILKIKFHYVPENIRAPDA